METRPRNIRNVENMPKGRTKESNQAHIGNDTLSNKPNIIQQPIRAIPGNAERYYEIVSDGTKRARYFRFDTRIRAAFKSYSGIEIKKGEIISSEESFYIIWEVIHIDKTTLDRGFLYKVGDFGLTYYMSNHPEPHVYITDMGPFNSQVRIMKHIQLLYEDNRNKALE